MSSTVLGALLASGTALCWCCSALAFEAAGRRVGSVPVNVLRLLAALLMLTLARSLIGPGPLPLEATPHQWQWLLLSGFVGFFIGDITLFRAFVLIGARLTTLIACTAPIFTLLTELLALPGARFGLMHVLGVLVTVGGVIWVVLERTKSASQQRVSVWGVLLALCGAMGQGVGLVLTDLASEPSGLDVLGAGQIRMLAGLPCFVLFALLTRRLHDTRTAFQDRTALGLICLGAFWGPFLGVSLLILSLNYATPSLSQTITCLVPVLIIPFAIFLRRERISPRAVLGACIAVAGVWLLIYAPSS